MTTAMSIATLTELAPTEGRGTTNHDAITERLGSDEDSPSGVRRSRSRAEPPPSRRTGAQRRRVIGHLLALSLATLLVLAMAPRPAQAHHYDHLLPAAGYCGPDTDVSASTHQTRHARCLINQARARVGLIRLDSGCSPSQSGSGITLGRCQGALAARQANRLNASAVSKARDIMSCQRPEPSSTWVHTACGRLIGHWVQARHYGVGCPSWPGFAENVYVGFGASASARAAVSWWLHSDVHRNNMLDSRWTQQGLAIEKGTFQGTAGSQVWVSHLGYSC